MQVKKKLRWNTAVERQLNVSTMDTLFQKHTIQILGNVPRYIVRQDEFAWLLLLLPPLLDSKFDSLRFPFSLALKLRTLLTENCNGVTKRKRKALAAQQ